jgi:UDP-4-amino-4,6-dideoxy-L-N-acetyl-beta-L-altrosamine transaminase
MKDLPFLPYAKHHISDEDCDAVCQSLKSQVITRGKTVDAFEAALADYCGVRFAVAFNSGSTALRAACAAAQLCAHDKFMTTPNSFVATAAAGILAGASPIFIDIDPETGNMDLDLLAPNLQEEQTRGRKVVMPVHYAGVPVNMERLQSLLCNPDAVVIEDAAASLGTLYDPDTRVGSCRWSDMTVFSFHPAKLITTGEGGMVTTNDPDLNNRLRAFRNNGIQREPGAWHYDVNSLSGNYNVTDFQAALGLSQFNRIESFIHQKKQVISWYELNLAGIPHVRLLSKLTEELISPHLAVVFIDFAALGTSRDELIAQLEVKGIGTQVHYIPIYRHPVFTQYYGTLDEYFPGMERFYSQALSLPLSVDLTEADVKRVCQAIQEIISAKIK